MENDQHQNCLNCNHVLTNRYCSNCGQKDKCYEPTFNQWALAVWDDFVSIDAKLINTFKALFIPGKYASDWLAGRQMRYVHPVRLYIFLSIIFSLLTYLGVQSEAYFQALIDGFMQSYKNNTLNSERSAQQLQVSQQIIQTISFLLIPVTIISAQIYGRKFLMIKNVFFVVCCFSLFVLMQIVVALLYQLSSSEIYRDAIELLFIVACCLFTLVSAKKVYSKGWISSLLRTVVFISFNLMMIISTVGITYFVFDAHEKANTSNVKIVKDQELKN